ncbi:MAG: molybdopterin-guanine dinucleotide biosynthesis protein B [Tissierellales bacterium]|jgi:molybdopterin-guanine dinucleotide biosynthesis adapter protein|nr:molybdopterin-guanine dinucleotide biosynthesis protein B [Tissierellales bacterium]MBN2827995.1 molybdopterin-guanine dinucleotide biosynthesis protein B [Tissierellales bacterium]
MTASVAFVGKSNSGKTTLIIKLITRLKQQGYRVGTIKHHNHESHFDQKGKDTYEHYEAGAERVIISSPSGYGVFSRVKNEMSLSSLIELNQDMDLVIIEGYKNTDGHKIEIVRTARSQEMICKEDEIIALITDTDIKISKPVFHIDDDEAIAEFLIKSIIERR